MAERALEEGISPLDVMLTTMRTLWDQAVDDDGRVINIGKAMQANVVAKDAAPFIHPKLSTIDANVEADVTAKVSRIELVGVRPSGDS